MTKVCDPGAAGAEVMATDIPPLTDEEASHIQHSLLKYTPPAIEQYFPRALRRIEQDRARIEELEQALRLNLAVAPNDPILIEPVEQEIARLTAENERLTAENSELNEHVRGLNNIHVVDLRRSELLGEQAKRLTADLAACRTIIYAWFEQGEICPMCNTDPHLDTCWVPAALARLEK